MPTVKKAMKAFPYSIDAEASIPEAREMMQGHDIRHLPVTHNHEIIGMLSERDIHVTRNLGRRHAVGESQARIGQRHCTCSRV